RAVAGVDSSPFSKFLERRSIHVAAVALTHEGCAPFVRDEAKPVEVFEQGRREFRTRSNTVVIFDPKQDPSAQRSRQTPRVDGVDDVPEVKIAGWRGGEPCDRIVLERGARGVQIGADGAHAVSRLMLHFTLGCSRPRRGPVIPYLDTDDPFPPVDLALR